MSTRSQSSKKKQRLQVSEQKTQAKKHNKKCKTLPKEEINLAKTKFSNPVKMQKLQKKLAVDKKVSICSENFVMCKQTDFQLDYQIIGKIGEGSFGTVYKVRHKTLNIERALKKIQKNPENKFSSFDEIQVLKMLDHKNILKIYQFYQSEDNYMIVTDFFEGKQLFDVIVESQKLNQEIASKIIKQILSTLNYTHLMNIAHRDIKPENILLSNFNQKGEPKIKIIDWGLGTLLNGQSSDRVCGTPQYAAPQIFQGKYTVQCDMWSLGVLSFIMLTGNMPFKGSNTCQTISAVKKCVINYRRSGFNNLSENAKDFISSLIQKDPKKRATAAEALQHKWILNHNQKKEEPQFLKQTLERLKQYNITNHFGSAVINLINNHFSTNEERQKLGQVFAFLDTNQDGVLSKQQLIQGYSKIYGKESAQIISEQILKRLDVNGSGTLDYSQFIAYGLKRDRQNQKNKLKEAFNVFDVDKNGTISLNQIKRILEGKVHDLDENDIKVIIYQNTKDKDNLEKQSKQEINFQEFYNLMESVMSKVSEIKESKRSQAKSHLIEQTVKKVPIISKISLKKTQSINQDVEESVLLKQQEIIKGRKKMNYGKYKEKR